MGVMRVIVIDSAKRQVRAEVIDMRKDLLTSLQRIVTDGRGGLVERVLKLEGENKKPHDLLVDEEGALGTPEAFFSFDTFGFLAGTGCIVGVKGSEWIDCTMTEEEVAARVGFYSRSEMAAKLVRK